MFEECRIFRAGRRREEVDAEEWENGRIEMPNRAREKFRGKEVEERKGERRAEEREILGGLSSPGALAAVLRNWRQKHKQSVHHCYGNCSTQPYSDNRAERERERERECACACVCSCASG